MKEVERRTRVTRRSREKLVEEDAHGSSEAAWALALATVGGDAVASASRDDSSASASDDDSSAPFDALVAQFRVLGEDAPLGDDDDVPTDGNRDDDGREGNVQRDEPREDEARSSDDDRGGRAEKPERAAVQSEAGGAETRASVAFSFNSDSEEDATYVQERGRLDVAALAALVSEGQSTLDAVRDKECVILVGNTGAGKSTFVQKVAGRQISASVDAASERRVYVVAAATDDDAASSLKPLVGSEIGHHAASKTKRLNHFERESGVVYVDTSGFEDTAGLEAEIALSISVKKLAGACTSVRFVVLVNSGAFTVDRAQSMRGVAESIASFVGDNFKSHQEAFTFLFTHVGALAESRAHGAPAEAVVVGNKPHEPLADARAALLKELNLTRSESKGVVRDVLTCIIRRLRNNRPLCDVFHPLLSDAQALADSIEANSLPIAEPQKIVRSGGTGATALLRFRHELKSLTERVDHKLQHSEVADVTEEIAATSFLGANLELDATCAAPSRKPS